MKPLVDIQHLVKYFDIGGNQRVHAVDDVSLSINPREIVGLVGESGSGKSTLGKTLLGLHDKTSGSVSFAGKQFPQRYQAKDFRAMAPKMQMIFKDPYSSLNPRMTVGEIVAEGLRLQPQLSASDVQERVSALVILGGVKPRPPLAIPPRVLRGQRQRIGIARALILQPEFIVCDEPISALGCLGTGTGGQSFG